MSFTAAGIIPARYASTRFPGKPLADIHGKTMIRRVYEQSSKASLLQKVFVATDDQRIFDHVSDFGGNAIMTSVNHRTGTERCNEALEIIGTRNYHPDVVINIQGDEPYIDPSQIDNTVSLFKQEQIQIATLVKKISDKTDLSNKNIIKVVFDLYHKAIYFSRAAIPYSIYDMDKYPENQPVHFKHIGIYAYRNEVLKQIAQLAPSPLETAESLEQLRWIENGYSIHVEITTSESHSVDVPDDIFKLKKD